MTAAEPAWRTAAGAWAVAFSTNKAACPQYHCGGFAVKDDRIVTTTPAGDISTGTVRVNATVAASGFFMTTATLQGQVGDGSIAMTVGTGTGSRTLACDGPVHPAAVVVASMTGGITVDDTLAVEFAGQGSLVINAFGWAVPFDASAFGVGIAATSQESSATECL